MVTEQALLFSKREELKQACSQFEEATGCKVLVTSFIDVKHGKRSFLSIIIPMFKAIFQAATAPKSEISIKVAWKTSGEAYAIDNIAVATSNATVRRFPKDALREFRDTLQRYQEAIASMEDTKVHEKIAEALERLKEKKVDLVELLRKRIVEKLSTSKEQFQLYAYQHQNELSNIVVFDKSYGGGGKYVNKQLIIGTGQKVNNSNEDILSTIYHEYMHYLNDKYKIFLYRMENVEKGIVYTKMIPQYERRMETQEEFLMDAYQSYLTFLLNTPDKIEYALNLPSSYNEFTASQTFDLYAHIKNEKLTPQIKYFTYQYLPSNYCLDEINAHQETLKATDDQVFTMGITKVQFYYSEIVRYNKLRKKAQEYENNNNINPTGHEK